MNIDFPHGPFRVHVTDDYGVVEALEKETGDSSVVTTDVLPRGSAFVVVRHDAAQGGTGRVVGVQELRPTTALDRFSTTDAYRLYFHVEVGSARLRDPEYPAALQAGLRAANEHAGPRRLERVLGS